jgi:hypothetical protein
MNVTTMLISGGIVLFLGIVAGVIWYGITRAKWKYNFELTTRDGKNSRLIKAKITSDPDNPKIQRFAFKENSSLLMIKEPDGSFEGKPIRRITYNSEGKYVYLTGYSVDEHNYLKMSLKPEARELALYQYQANQRRNPVLDKLQMATLITGVVLFILILGSIVFMSIKFYKASDNVVEISSSLETFSNNWKSYTDVSLEINKIFLGASNNLASYCGELKVTGGNLSRVLEPQDFE